jgi:adenylate cyclase
MKKHLNKILYGALLGFSAALIVWLVSKYFANEILNQYEARTYDWRIKKKIQDVAEAAIDEIIIVDIDGRAVSLLGKFSQWPHTHHARIIENLNNNGARYIGLDILFDKQIYNVHQSDTFVETVKKAGNVYNALYFDKSDTLNWRYEMLEEPKGFNSNAYYVEVEGENLPTFRREERFENEFIELLNASKGNGHVNFSSDADGVVRSIHLFTKFNNHLYPSLAFKMFLDIKNIDLLRMRGGEYMDLYSGESLVTSVPVDENGNMNITFYGSYKTYRYISYYDILENRVDEDNIGTEDHYFYNKIFLVGTSLAGLFDLRNTPMLQAFPGVEIHANILKTLLDGNFVTRMTDGETFILMALIGVFIGILMSYLSPLYSIIFVIIFSAVYVFITSAIFFDNNLWIEIVAPLLTIFVAFSTIYLYRYATEERNKRFIRSTFSHFVTKSVVDELLANPDKIKLGGEKKICTVMFSDVAGFTTISEKLTPEALVSLLNDYLTQMTNIIFKYDGMLDKYEGDAIMAVYGAPVSKGNDAYNACISALEMQSALARMRELWRKQGRDELHARIGLNTGPMVVGNMGSETRFDYTVMGDSVNLGARLEPACKQYGVNIMIGHETFQQAKEKIYARQLDLLRVKGKTEPVKVYELAGVVEQGISKDKERLLALFENGFKKYLEQKWEEALTLFNQALAIDPKDGPSKIYVKRCTLFSQNPPASDWDGVFVMTTK